jgi:hypothetical protein
MSLLFKVISFRALYFFLQSANAKETKIMAAPEQSAATTYQVNIPAGLLWSNAAKLFETKLWMKR